MNKRLAVKIKTISKYIEFYIHSDSGLEFSGCGGSKTSYFSNSAGQGGPLWGGHLWAETWMISGRELRVSGKCPAPYPPSNPTILAVNLLRHKSVFYSPSTAPLEDILYFLVQVIYQLSWFRNPNSMPRGSSNVFLRFHSSPEGSWVLFKPPCKLGLGVQQSPFHSAAHPTGAHTHTQTHS